MALCQRRASQAPLINIPFEVFTFEQMLAVRFFKIRGANHTVRTRKHEGCFMQRRKRSVLHSFEDQIAAEKARLEAQVASLPPSPQQDALRKKIRQLDTAAHINEWISSPELRPPKLP
jgi:hypothetical protein